MYKEYLTAQLILLHRRIILTKRSLLIDEQKLYLTASEHQTIQHGRSALAREELFFNIKAKEHSTTAFHFSNDCLTDRELHEVCDRIKEVEDLRAALNVLEFQLTQKQAEAAIKDLLN